MSTLSTQSTLGKQSNLGRQSIASFVKFVLEATWWAVAIGLGLLVVLLV